MQASMPRHKPDRTLRQAERAGKQGLDAPIGQVALGRLPHPYVVTFHRDTGHELLFGTRHGMDLYVHVLHFSTIFASICEFF